MSAATLAVKARCAVLVLGRGATAECRSVTDGISTLRRETQHFSIGFFSQSLQELPRGQNRNAFDETSIAAASSSDHGLESGSPSGSTFGAP